MNVAIQREVKKGMYIVLDCFAIARNDGVNLTNLLSLAMTGLSAKAPQSR